MINKIKELINILCQYFPNTYKTTLINPADEWLTAAGVTHMLAEGEGRFSSSSSTAKFAVNWMCVRDVVLGFFDVNSLIGEYTSLIKGGGSWSTVRGLLWRTARRYAGWVGAAALVYDLSKNCLSV